MVIGVHHFSPQNVSTLRLKDRQKNTNFQICTLRPSHFLNLAVYLVVIIHCSCFTAHHSCFIAYRLLLVARVLLPSAMKGRYPPFSNFKFSQKNCEPPIFISQRKTMRTSRLMGPWMKFCHLFRGFF